MPQNARPSITRSLHLFAFCLNLGFAIALALSLFALRAPMTFVHQHVERADLYHQLAIRANLMFHRVPWDVMGTNIALTIVALSCCGILVFTMKLIDQTTAADILLSIGAGVTAITAVPALWFPYEPTSDMYGGIDARAWYVVALEFAIIAAALYLTRHRAGASWFAILAVHYGVWSWFLIERAPLALLSFPCLWPIVLSAVAPFAGFMWAVYMSELRKSRRYGVSPES